jgi:probable rRNA maturation factor
MPAPRPGRRKSARLDLSICASDGSEFIPFLRRNLIAAHRLIAPPLKQLSVALVTGAEMRRLHRKYLSQAGLTDVLTFELAHDSRGRVTEGEVIICPAAARSVVGSNKPDVGRELLLYALHGMLHLCAMDDRTDREFQIMHEREDQILIRLGIGAVFDAQRRAGRAKIAARRAGAAR